MKCGKVQEWISQEMDGQLAAEHVAPLAEHLEICASCREFRDELRVGLRMLHATDPVLPDNFDWKLQLRLSRAMREAARDATYPWSREGAGWRRWLARAGFSAAVGLAAVLSVALLTPARMSPVLTDASGTAPLTNQAPRVPLQTAPTSGTLFDATRRPLDPGYASRLGSGLQRNVSSRSGVGGAFWSGADDRDLLRIRQLELEVESLRRRLGARDRQIQFLEAKLDSVTGRVVDTP